MPTPYQPRKSRTKWLVLIVALGAAAFAGKTLFFSKGGAAPSAAMAGMMGGPVPVSVATVVTRPVTEWQEFSGMFEAVHAVEVRPRVSGQITAIHFTDGAEVTQGQPLFTIDPRPYAAELARAKGSLASAAAAQANAAQEFARAKKLVKSKAISQSEYDAKGAALSQANGALESARGALNAAEVNLGYTHIAAPISGKISRAEITVGNLVNAASPPLLASIVDLSPIYASFDVDEATFIQTVQGASAETLAAIPVEVGVGNGAAQLTQAAIHSFDNQLKPGSGTIRVRALLKNETRTIVPGLYARVRLGNAPRETVLINPTAVNTDQDKKFVLVVDDANKTEYRPVTLGGMDGGLQIVRAGLKPGERMVVNGLQRAKPGIEVKAEMVDMDTLKPLDAPAQAEPQAPQAEVVQ